MVKRIVFLSAWLVGVALLHLFGNNLGTFVVFTASAVVPALSALVVFVLSKQSRFMTEIIIPAPCAKGGEITCNLSVVNKGALPVYNISCILVCENLYTGEVVREQLFFNVRRRRSTEIMFSLHPVYCGCLKLTASTFTMADPLGLFKARLNCAAERRITVLPNGFELDIHIAENINAVADNDEYSMTRPGSDSSEIYAVREYVPGDPIKSIHWKLTEKLDKVMVREFGLPIAKQALVLFEIPPDAAPPAKDAAAEVFYSVILALLKNGVYTTVAGQCGDEFAEYVICSPEDAFGAIARFLTSGGGSIDSLYYERYASCPIIVVTSSDATGVNLIQNDRITVLQCGSLEEFHSVGEFHNLDLEI